MGVLRAAPLVSKGTRGRRGRGRLGVRGRGPAFAKLCDNSASRSFGTEWPEAMRQKAPATSSARSCSPRSPGAVGAVEDAARRGTGRAAARAAAGMDGYPLDGSRRTGGGASFLSFFFLLSFFFSSFFSFLSFICVFLFFRRHPRYHERAGVGRTATRRPGQEARGRRAAGGVPGGRMVTARGPRRGPGDADGQARSGGVGGTELLVRGAPTRR